MTDEVIMHVGHPGRSASILCRGQPIYGTADLNVKVGLTKDLTRRLACPIDMDRKRLYMRHQNISVENNAVQTDKKYPASNNFTC